MALVHMQDMLKHAYDNGYAVGSFNLLGLSEPHFSRYDIRVLLPAVEAAAKQAEVPVAVHYQSLNRE